MVSLINKKGFNLSNYERILCSDMTNSFVFFVSQFGDKASTSAIKLLRVKSCKVSLIRKIVQNDLISGPSCLFFLDSSKLNSLSINFLLVKSLDEVRSFISNSYTSFRIQNVIFGSYLIDYDYLELLIRPTIGLLSTFLYTNSSTLILPILYFLSFLSRFFNFLFIQNARLFNILNFQRSKNC